MAQSEPTPVLTISKMVVFEVVPKEAPQSTELSLVGLPTEIRLEILQYLLPNLRRIPYRPLSSICRPRSHQQGAHWNSDSDSDASWNPRAASTYISLRHDGESCHPAVMRVCRSLYEECRSIIFSPTRTFDAELYYSGSVTLCLLSKNRWHLGNPPTWPFGTMIDPEKELLKRYLGSIKSLHLRLPMYRVPLSGSVRPAIVAFVTLLQRLFPEELPLNRLTVNVTLPQRHRGFIDENPDEMLEKHQASLKWMLQPFQRLSNFERDHVQFLAHGIPLEEACRDKTPDLVKYVKKLSLVMSRKDERGRREVPSQAHKLSRMLACSTALHKISDLIQVEGPPQSPVRLKFNPVRNIANEYTDSADVLMWDAWERGQWDEMKSEYQRIKENWDRLSKLMADACHEVDEMFDSIGPSKAEELIDEYHGVDYVGDEEHFP